MCLGNATATYNKNRLEFGTMQSAYAVQRVEIMRKLSIRKKVNALTAAIAIIAFVAVLFVLALTFPPVAVDFKAVSADNNVGTGSPSAIADANNSVTDTDGDGTTLEVLDPDEIEGLEDGSLPMSGAQYIKAKNYENDTNWQAIRTAADLKTWLTTDPTKNAYLDNPIDNFSHGTGADAINLNASIKAGKTLDGCGYTVNIKISGEGEKNVSANKTIVGLFAKEVLGTLKNTKFTFEKIDTGVINMWTNDNDSLYAGLLIGCVGSETLGEANMGIVENISLDILPFASGGAIKYSTYAYGRGATAYMRSGSIAGVVKNGIVRNVTLIQTGGYIYLQGGAGAPWPFSSNNYTDSGTMIGQVGWGDKTGYVYNIVARGNGTTYDVESTFHNPALGTIGIVDSNIDIRGIYVELKPTTLDFSGVYMYVAQPRVGGDANQDKTELFSKALYSKSDGDRDGEAFFRLAQSQDIRFAKPDPLKNTLSLDEYKAVCTRVIINDTAAPNDKILWRVNRSSSATVDADVFDRYETYGIMQQAGANTYISLSTRAEEALSGKGGNRIQFVYGDKITLSSIESKTTTYNGEAHTTVPKFIYADGSEFSADVLNYKTLYNNSVNPPILPSSAAYKVTVRDRADSNFAYLDTTNKVIAPINDAIEGTIRINYADITVTSIMCDSVEYVGNYVNKPIEYTVDFTTSVTAPSSGYRIIYRETIGDVRTWSSGVVGNTAYVTPTGGYNTGDKTYIFKLQAQNANGQWVDVSNPTGEEVTFLYDDFKPSTQYLSSYVSGTWHTASSNIIISPKPVTRFASASVMLRYVNENGGEPTEWVKADGTFQNEEGFWVDGFQISDDGKTYFQLRAVSETGAVGDINTYEVWIDRNDYTVDYEVSLVSGMPLDKSAINLIGTTTIKRNDTPKLTLNTDDNGALSYYIAEIDGTNYDNLTEALYDYSISKDMTIGDVPETIKIKVRKGVKLCFATPDSVIYGDEILLPQPNVEGLINDNTIDDLSVTVEFVGDELSTAGVKSAGSHEFTAKIVHEDYVANVENAFIEVLQKELRVDLNPHAYRYLLDEFLGYGEDAWKQFGLSFVDDTMILDGDSVSIAGVTYNKEIDTYGTYTFLSVLDNANYKVPDVDKGILILSMLNYNYSALDGEGAYELRTTSDFKSINDFQELLNENFVLMADIDLTALDDAAIKGTFKGKFDGNNHRLYNVLMVNYGLENYGLFYKIVGGEVKNLIIDNMSIGIYTSSNAGSNVGLLAGEISGAIIDNIIIRGEIRITDESASINVGGIAGKANTALIENIAYIATLEVYSTGKVTYGGIVGDANNLELVNIEYIGVARINSNVTESAVGYVTGNIDDSTTVANVSYINKSIGFNGGRVDIPADTEGQENSVDYATMANSTNTYAGEEFGALLKGSVDPRYFGKNIYGTGGDDTFIITNYNQLVATIIYPYATFKLANNIICHTVNMYDPTNFFGTLDKNGFDITDISGNVIA